MGTITDFSELALLDHILKNTAYTQKSAVYLAFFTSDPTDAGTVSSEPSGFGYARPTITFLGASSRKIIQNGQVNFPQITGGTWGTITHWGIMDMITGGDMLAHGQLSPPIITVEDNIPFIPDAQLTVEFQTGAISTYLANKLLDFMFRNTPYTQPDTFVAMCSAAITDASTGSTITEPTGNYARVDFSDWKVAVAGATENNSAITFPVPTANWPLITYSALVDAIIDGNILIYGTSTPNQAPLIGDPVNYPIGAYDITMD